MSTPDRSAITGELSYEQASARIEDIIRRLDSGEAGLRETLDLVREGRGLIEFCARELQDVGQGLEQLHLDELVARLQEEAGAGGPPPPAAGERSP
jgi:exodeoxyribonuclease VII small subunit